MPLADKKILVIDDTDSIRIFLRISLEMYGARFFEAATANSGVQKCKEISPDLVVLDLGLPDRDGLEILPEIKEYANQHQSSKIVILSVRKEQKTKDLAMQLGADAYITKPFMMEELMEVVQHQLDLI